MTEKTTRQIESIKNDYNFGVEVEMNHITRQKAAKVAADFFGTGRYENTAYRNGYMTWSAFSEDGREWKFSRDVSIAGPDDEKCELVTPILGYDDIPTLQELLRQLRHKGAVSNPSVGAGVHIHVSRKGGFTVQEVKNLVNIMAAHESQIGRAIRIDEGRTGHYCKVVDHRFLDRLNRQKPKTMAKLADCWYEGNGARYGRTEHYNDSRYHMVNLHAFFSKGTIEFRLFNSTLHAGKIKAYIQLCLALSAWSITSKDKLIFRSMADYTPAKKVTIMRNILLRRLGLTGEEFETCRHHLMAPLKKAAGMNTRDSEAA